ncbi:aspartate kinase [Haladaptatus sp. F3-133]|jgi:aspartate kinase|uniref:Aspartokinase n=1 Tax=Halorutilus salinus TaxID=2487751 RepID=A0A9Q4C4G0_9EURY|nr:aspartate kinase [Halorutilus salinus]MCX2818815.1 aspartate kinase [Halorutilus salinus]
MSKIVAKFGGTSVGTGERMRKAAESIADVVDAGDEACVVVSAMGKTTDMLIEEMEKVADDGPRDEDADEIVSMGERTSVRMFKTALGDLGVDSFFVEPGDDDWPVVTDEAGEVDEKETHRRVQRLGERMEDAVPVVCGFLGETDDGTLTTLGRGGSDTTAMLIGNHLGADEVVIVTDVEGIMTGDPSNVERAKSVDSISVDEMQDLSIRGAGVVAPSALRYKTNGMTVRVVHHEHGDIRAEGTVIEGEGTSTHLVEMRDEPLAAVTVAGRSVIDTPNLLSRLSTTLGENDINIYGHSTGNDSMSFFVDQNKGRHAEKLLHDEIVEDAKFSSVSVREDVAMILVSGGDFIDTPGIVYRVVKPLYERGINIIEIISSVTSIVIFVDRGERQDAFELIEGALEAYEDE